MIAAEDYDHLTGQSKQPKDIVQFFQQSPLYGLDLDFERDPDQGRDIEV